MEEGEMSSLVRRALENARAVEREDTVGIYAGGEKYAEAEKKDFAGLDAADLKSLATTLE
jgi:hypothetical protein